MLRLFIALPLPEDIRGRLAGICNGLPGARWVSPENMHLTLRFIGEVGHGEAADIDVALSTLRAPAFDVMLDRLGTFGRPKPHALWAGAERGEPLLRLQSKVEGAVTRSGMKHEERKFMPRVTLARLRGAPPARLEAFIADNHLFRPGHLRVEPWQGKERC